MVAPAASKLAQLSQKRLLHAEYQVLGWYSSVMWKNLQVYFWSGKRKMYSEKGQLSSALFTAWSGVRTELLCTTFAYRKERCWLPNCWCLSALNMDLTCSTCQYQGCENTYIYWHSLQSHCPPKTWVSITAREKRVDCKVKRWEHVIWSFHHK